MNTYERLRKLNWPAIKAFEISKVESEFASLERLGRVRFSVQPDLDWSFEDLAGDAFNRRVNPDIQESRMVREEQEFRDRIEQDGVWSIISEVMCDDGWETAGSSYGFIGDDWKDSFYDTDVKRDAIVTSLAQRELQMSLSSATYTLTRGKVTIARDAPGEVYAEYTNNEGVCSHSHVHSITDARTAYASAGTILGAHYGIKDGEANVAASTVSALACALHDMARE